MTRGMMAVPIRASVLAILTAVAALAAGSWLRAPSREYVRHYAVFMEGARAGWLRTSLHGEGDVATTTREMKFDVRRGKTRSTSSMSTRFVETSAGKPVSMSATHQMGAVPVVVNYEFKGERIEVVADPGGARTVTSVDAPKETWLTPAAAASFVRQRLIARAGEITYRTMDPLTGPQVVTVTHSGIRPESRRIDGREIDGFTMETTASNAPGTVSIDFVDGEGNPVIQRAMLGGLSVEFVLAGPEVVTQATAAPELMVSTFVKPDRKIADPRRSTRSVYVLDFVTGPPPPIPQTGSQSVTSIDGTKATISIDVTTPHPAPEEDLDDPAYRDPSGVVSSRDPGVVEIAARAVKDIPADDARRRAEALKRAVDRHITKKSLDVGFAGAAEVARNREGDCSEHAVLLAATLRSVGIPSRIAGGLVYVDEFAGARDCFGYHMWTQALIDVGGSSRWIDLDATMSANSGFDATHVALTVSPLADDRGMLDLLGIAQAMGRLAISVHSVEYER